MHIAGFTADNTRAIELNISHKNVCARFSSFRHPLEFPMCGRKYWLNPWQLDRRGVNSLFKSHLHLLFGDAIIFQGLLIAGIQRDPAVAIWCLFIASCYSYFILGLTGLGELVLTDWMDSLNMLAMVALLHCPKQTKEQRFVQQQLEEVRRPTHKSQWYDVPVRIMPSKHQKALEVYGRAPMVPHLIIITWSLFRIPFWGGVKA